MGIQHADSIAMEHARKWGGRSTKGMSGLAGATAENPLSQQPTRRGRGAAMGRGRGKGKTTEASGNLKAQNPREWGETMGAVRPLEWRKTPGGAATEWAGESSRLRTTQPPTEWAGESSRLRTTRPPERHRDPGETKPREPSQRPDNDRGGRTRAGGRGRKPTH